MGQLGSKEFPVGNNLTQSSCFWSFCLQGVRSRIHRGVHLTKLRGRSASSLPSSCSLFPITVATATTGNPIVQSQPAMFCGPTTHQKPVGDGFDPQSAAPFVPLPWTAVVWVRTGTHYQPWSFMPQTDTLYITIFYY